jgi:hypothetical protein
MALKLLLSGIPSLETCSRGAEDTKSIIANTINDTGTEITNKTSIPSYFVGLIKNKYQLTGRVRLPMPIFNRMQDNRRCLLAILESD